MSLHLGRTMDLRDLRAFVAIAEAGSLMAAAKTLNSSPPALSARLKNLEDELGTTLFMRWARGLSLTDQAREFLVHSYAILKQAEDAKASILGRDKVPLGVVRLGIPGSLIGILSVPLIERCLQEFPQIRLRVVESMSGYLTRWLREGMLDATLLFGTYSPEDSGASVKPILEEDLYLGTCDPSLLHPFLNEHAEIPMRALSHLRLVMPGPEHGLRSVVEATARRHDVPLDIAIEIDASPQIFELVRRGHGSTICSLAARHFGAPLDGTGLPKLHTFRIVEPGFQRTVSVATPLNRPSSGATTAVVRLAANILVELAETKEWRARRLSA
ncbi:LysR substrate-binding domain-containing protein [Pseudoroseomonas wenyumeiae]